MYNTIQKKLGESSMKLKQKIFYQLFFICFFLFVLILVGCSKQTEKWNYSVSSSIVSDKSIIEEIHPDIPGNYQNMAVVEVKLISMYTANLTNLDVHLDFPQNESLKLYSHGSSSSTVIKKNDEIEYSFEIILDQSETDTIALLGQSKIIIEWEQSGNRERFEINLSNG